MPAFSCAFSRDFDAEVCEEEQPAGGGVGVLIPAAIPRIPKRKKKECADLRGKLWIVVIGVGRCEAVPSRAALALEEMRDLQSRGEFLQAMKAIEPHRKLFPKMYDEAIVLWATLQAIPAMDRHAAEQKKREAAEADRRRQQAEQERQAWLLNNGYLPDGRRGHRMLMCTNCKTKQRFHGYWASHPLNRGRWSCTKCGHPEAKR